ncbi:MULTISPECIES: outer membrane protein [Aurantimonas]|uniref:outer membrane protein n=1 Tax=Aurantimonas TaxID=182269 RepID=UPI001651EE85|nr:MULTISPECIES: outer membrane protein [Aurantimonas]MBC6715776.1 porin family protein [Aurantimonas sp. DM33-3]MCD1642793.1 porin family protein [Aurantimonas coralicida]
MKRLALLLATTAFVTPALAADVIYEEPPAPAPMAIEPVATTATWTGLYIGGQAGVAFGNDSGSIGFDPGNNGAFGNGTLDNGDDSDAGFIGGAHIGYDYQINDFVVGAVADINYIDAETKRSYTTPGGSTFSADSEINYLGTVRARVGYAMDSVLLYGTGGLAYAGVDNNMSAPTGTEFNGYTFEQDEDDTDIGYAVGGGVDVMATNNISFGVEYLYTNLGSNDQTVTGTNGTNTVNFTSESNDDDLDFHTIWAKASYRFN